MIGKHVLLGKEDLDLLSEARAEQILEATSRLKEFLVGNDLAAANTLFDKKNAKKVTYSKSPLPTNSPPYTHARYSQIDYILVGRRWRASRRTALTKLLRAPWGVHAALPFTS